MTEAQPVPHVVVIGGGFGGVHVARGLRKANVRVTLIDRRNHHLFQPLLYQVATAGLTAADIAYPIRKMFRRQKNCTVYLADVLRIDRRARRVFLRDGEVVTYDALVVATGVTHDYFGNDEWAEHAPGLKSLDEALEIRRRVLTAYENAEREDDPDARAAWLTFAVVGAGPTGVEMAGALAEIAKKTLARDFRRVRPEHARIVLVDASDRVLQGFSPAMSERAHQQLEAVGVRIELGRRVTTVDDDGLSFGSDRLSAKTVIWAAGVRATGLIATLATGTDRAGRAEVTPALHLPDDPKVYVIGDAAALQQDGEQLPGVAQVAIQQGGHVAKNIVRSLAQAPQTAFTYKDKGSLATIGRSKAVAEIGSWRFGGFWAWLVWVWVHILFLVGFRNRFVVFFEWIWAYFTYSRSARVILEQPFKTVAHRDQIPEITEAIDNKTDAAGETTP